MRAGLHPFLSWGTLRFFERFHRAARHVRSARASQEFITPACVLGAHGVCPFASFMRRVFLRAMHIHRAARHVRSARASQEFITPACVLGAHGVCPFASFMRRVFLRVMHVHIQLA